ncbi:mannonate dehydratase [Pedobacter sp. Leaf194]|uniref:mannonate dehydratase n=1 Tax=Pedobacter sp. Leaf194 TaxID=1736297 RepID=UPI000703BA53|nr:mannonate dehydratase [Pedobacter sp. Leaf194]KQS36783.1 mannonate dehydratase [Pedobacter sp. Leaf194]
MNNIKKLEQTFRWFGPEDEVNLQYIRQTGATGIVTALHDIPCGEVWGTKEIYNRKRMIEESGLTWSVIESINIHESIKTAAPDRAEWIQKYLESLTNVAACGLKVVCYNFMPVLDWTRTDLNYILANGASALRYDAASLAAFDLFILKRAGAENEFTAVEKEAASACFNKMSEQEKTVLQNTIMAGLPGTDEVFSISEFKSHLRRYENIDAEKLRENLIYFLTAIIPTAEKLGIKMCIHPDDPPFPILGLPRIVCNESDIARIISAVPSPSNGITFCTGSLGANPVNNLTEIIRKFGSNIHFLHLRNVKKEKDGSFFEADHLDGDNNMAAIMSAIIEEQKLRFLKGRTDVSIPMRPDHGHKILDDFNHQCYPGYSAIGRMKGLAELRGLELGLRAII